MGAITPVVTTSVDNPARLWSHSVAGLSGFLEGCEFKKVVPDALSAEDWFRFHGRYANGERIVARGETV
jgi:hypothetical protein